MNNLRYSNRTAFNGQNGKGRNLNGRNALKGIGSRNYNNK